MHRLNPAPFVSLSLADSEMLTVGKLCLQVLHTPGQKIYIAQPLIDILMRRPAAGT
jgi:hypothetical protein